MAIFSRSGGVKKRSETWRLIITGLCGIVLGLTVGISSMRFGVPSNIGALHLQQPDVFGYRPPAPEEMTAATIACPGAQPPGTESLPRNILAPTSDLFPRRLWGKPEEDLPNKPKYLLTLTVGWAQKQMVDQAVSKFSKEWQIVLFHYDGRINEWDEFEWARNCSAYVVEPYDYIFVWDEDLNLDHFEADKYIELVKKHGLEISQPALEPDRGLTWQMTKRRGDVEVHKDTEEKAGWCPDPHKPPCAGFVEIMAPVFSRKAWRCVWYMIQNDLVHGWGLDFSLQRCAQPAYEKIGVVDAQWIRHNVVPSLGQQGDAGQGQPAREGVRERCKYEWKLFSERWDLADKQRELEQGKGEARPP